MEKKCASLDNRIVAILEAAIPDGIERACRTKIASSSHGRYNHGLSDPGDGLNAVDVSEIIRWLLPGAAYRRNHRTDRDKVGLSLPPA
jgi:hypothetical protein